MTTSLRSALADIDRRIADNEAHFVRLLQESSWSQLAGYHGIGTGLLMARQIVERELRSAAANKKEPV